MPVWQFNQDSFHLKAWGEEAVLFDIRSGDTHLLSSQVLSIIEVLQIQSLDEETLASRVAEKFGFDVDSQLVEEIRVILLNLKDNDIVEQV